MGRLDGKVAFISGAARGQGRSHAVRLAEEGADIIGFDICGPIDTVPYPLATQEDLEQTVKLVEDCGRRMVAKPADVRDSQAVGAVFDEGRAQLGRIDIVLANAGAMTGFGLPDMSMDTLIRSWRDALDIMLTGVFNTVVAALPSLISQGTGGSIVITSSTAGLKSMSGPAHTAEESLVAIGYTAAKTGVIGLMRAWAGALAHLSIRVNTVHPTGVSTPFIVNDMWARILEENPSAADGWRNAMPVELIDAVDVSNAIVWLCSEEARYVTGVMLPVDAGFTIL
jgi:SDR family mycofactocin-dependent oxidoreductase